MLNTYALFHNNHFLVRFRVIFLPPRTLHRTKHLRKILPLLRHFRDVVLTHHGNNAIADECCDVRHLGSWIMQRGWVLLHAFCFMYVGYSLHGCSDWVNGVWSEPFVIWNLCRFGVLLPATQRRRRRWVPLEIPKLKSFDFIQLSTGKLWWS